MYESIKEMLNRNHWPREVLWNAEGDRVYMLDDEGKAPGCNWAVVDVVDDVGTKEAVLFTKTEREALDHAKWLNDRGGDADTLPLVVRKAN